MHVHTETPLSPEQIESRFQNLGVTPESSARELTYKQERQPPKLFLGGLPCTLPAAAEVTLNQQTEKTEIILRLMWGPLPAPFPRAVAAIGVLLCILIALLSNNAIISWVLGPLLAIFPILALFYQKQGEKDLQEQLTQTLDGASFKAKPH